MKNLPAISDPSIINKLPEARANERDTLISKVCIQPNDNVLDIQAAAGYLTDKIYKNLDGQVNCYCLEPSEIHRSRLSPNYIAIDQEVEYFPEIQTSSIDVAVGLAGLHHSNDHFKTLSEVYRVLKPNAQFAICDVIKGSNIANWLNEFVDANTPSGHQGNFVETGQLINQCLELDFKCLKEEVVSVPWVFPSMALFHAFFKGIFGLTCDLSLVEKATQEYFKAEIYQDKVVVPWELLYISGRK